MEDIIIAGFGGHGKSVADCIQRLNRYSIVGYTDLEPHSSRYQYLGTDDVLEEYFDKGICNVAIGIGFMGRGSIRSRLYDRLKKIGYLLPAIVDPSAIISETAQIGEGTFIGKGAVLNADAKVGKMAIINTKALIEHESIVGDYVHIAVGAVLCGQVEIGNSAFIGANATVIQGMRVPPWGFVPAGDVVRKGDFNMVSGGDRKSVV